MESGFINLEPGEIKSLAQLFGNHDANSALFIASLAEIQRIWLSLP